MNMQEKATAMHDFMPPYFLEERLRRMEIWNAPRVKVFEDDHLEFTCEFVVWII